mmetsp:Transcript_23531/g.75927  ORF Transcript_23531/g.75927 Transcript_23531/m.75927 type:complete len:378 (+) Transcript_23531:308-1441(+)
MLYRFFISSSLASAEAITVGPPAASVASAAASLLRSWRRADPPGVAGAEGLRGVPLSDGRTGVAAREDVRRLGGGEAAPAASGLARERGVAEERPGVRRTALSEEGVIALARERGRAGDGGGMPRWAWTCTSSGAKEAGTFALRGVRVAPPRTSPCRQPSTSALRTSTIAASVASEDARICASSSVGASRSAAVIVARREARACTTGGRSIWRAISPSVLLSLARHLRTRADSSRCEGSAAFSPSNCSSAQRVGPRGECCSSLNMMKLSDSSRCCAVSEPKSARHGSRSRSSSSSTSRRICGCSSEPTSRTQPRRSMSSWRDFLHCGNADGARSAERSRRQSASQSGGSTSATASGDDSTALERAVSAWRTSGSADR